MVQILFFLQLLPLVVVVALEANLEPIYREVQAVLVEAVKMQQAALETHLP